MNQTQAAYETILAAFWALLDEVPRLDDMFGPVREVSWADTRCHQLPHIDEMRDALPDPSPFAHVVLDAAPFLDWQQSYKAAQVGEDYLAHYGWFNLLSPEGAFSHATRRVSIGYWGAGLLYPRHWHEPEELYYILSGSAEVKSDGRQPVQVEAGDLYYNEPNLPHEMQVQNSLLALAIWRGGGLNAVPDIG